MVLAEELNTDLVFTVERDFSAYRIRGRKAFGTFCLKCEKVSDSQSCKAWFLKRESPTELHIQKNHKVERNVFQA